MKKLLLLVLLFPLRLSAAEQVDLTTPLVADPRQATVLKIESILLDRVNSYIVIRVGDDNITRLFTYEGAEARNFMNILNTANLTNNSLHKRVLNKLIADGHLSGSVTGTPE